MVWQDKIDELNKRLQRSAAGGAEDVDADKAEKIMSIGCFFCA